ncbi:MAG: hypothetical protein EBU70_03840, partial [Actinobacteria bacterium]|nr:hypothetical protein [Actinomycetota bacterium]
MRGAIPLLAALVVSGCATTIVDVAPTSTAPDTTVAATVPSGSDDELMDLLGASMGRIAEALGERDRSAARSALADAQAAWRVLEPRLLARSAQLEEDAQRLVDLAATAVERNRPADADKAMRFLS